MKEYKKCKYCGEDVVAPHDYDFHIACMVMKSHEDILKLDVKDIKMKHDTKTTDKK